jgi:cytoskeletal protein RodZ
MLLRLIQRCIQHLTNIAPPRQLRPSPVNHLSFFNENYSHYQYLAAMEPQNGENGVAPSPVTAPVTSTTATTTSDTPSAIADVAPSTGDATEPSKLSKNQQKKLLKKQQFEASRPAWKAAKKEKEKARKQRKREEKAAAAENALKRKLSEDGEEVVPQAEVKRVKTQTVVENITLLMDCGFDDLMNDKVGTSSCPRPRAIEGRLC